MKTLKIILAISLLSLLQGCGKEKDASADKVYKTIHYSATATGGNVSKATLNGSDQYVFEADDRLFVCDAATNGTNLYGVLTLISGAGNRVAYFEGDLMCAEDFELLDTTPISVTLVGSSSNDMVHTVSGGKVTNTSYPSGQSASSLQEAIQKFSHFTCSTTYDATNFELSQQSCFLVVRVTMEAEEAPLGRVITANLYNNTNSLLRTATVTVSEAGSIPCVFAFRGGDVSLEDAVLHLEWTDSGGGSKEFDDISDQDLLANNYYTVSRTTIVNRYGGYRIIAREAGTITRTRGTASFEYSTDFGETWQSYSSGIPVSAGDEVCFRSTVTAWNNSSICSDHKFDIAGDIASLLLGSSYPDGSLPSSYSFINFLTNCDKLIDASQLVLSMKSLPNGVQVYKSFFENCVNLVAGPAELSATTLSNKCYRNMFNGCTSLTSAPVIRKPTSRSGEGWYQQMFMGCSSLQEIVFLDDYTYSATSFDNWVNGINASGTFYKSSTMTSFPAAGNSSTPSGWTVENYVSP